MRFFSPNRLQLQPTHRKLFFPFQNRAMNDRRIEHFLSEVGLYHLRANIAYGFQTESTRISTAFSRRPGGRLTNGRLPLFHFHHQRGCSSFRSNRISDELHRTEACLPNVAAKHTLSTLW